MRALLQGRELAHAGRADLFLREGGAHHLYGPGNGAGFRQRCCRRRPRQPLSCGLVLAGRRALRALLPRGGRQRRPADIMHRPRCRQRRIRHVGHPLLLPGERHRPGDPLGARRSHEHAQPEQAVARALACTLRWCPPLRSLDRSLGQRHCRDRRLRQRCLHLATACSGRRRGRRGEADRRRSWRGCNRGCLHGLFGPGRDGRGGWRRADVVADVRRHVAHPSAGQAPRRPASGDLRSRHGRQAQTSSHGLAGRPRPHVGHRADAAHQAVRALDGEGLHALRRALLPEPWSFVGCAGHGGGANTNGKRRSRWIMATLGHTAGGPGVANARGPQRGGDILGGARRQAAVRLARGNCLSLGPAERAHSAGRGLPASLANGSQGGLRGGCEGRPGQALLHEIPHLLRASRPAAQCKCEPDV
mmetsp:Transcript_51769/g.116538  ORF Transcript_51769/g.116538 Transcript_51769/m.116538 type:complete len:418 (+) Transcript_51769:188-1441(+)